MQKINISSLLNQFAESWQSSQIDQVNGNRVNLRVMEDITTNWHIHELSDELFYVISGTVNIDTEDGTQTLNSNEILVVPANMKHRARVKEKSVLLVIDKIC